MVRRLLGLFFIFICVLSFQEVSVAKVYMPPQELIDEVRERVAEMKEHPTSDNVRFELAMSYAYAGFVERGWFTLKKVDREFARTVVKNYEPIVQKNPMDWKSRFKLAFGYFFIKRKNDSKRQFEIILKQQPDHLWAMGFLALVEGEMGNTDRAIELCHRALELEPNAAPIHFLLAEGYRRKGQMMDMLGSLMTTGRLKAEQKIQGIDLDE